ncbi:MAG TPA: hypothetical protein ENK19_10040 [Acidobacteria bacterium]|nr:hypothetical protein [Acidobacteriota bacterium]
MDRIARIAAWLDTARPGWRNEDTGLVAEWANTPSVDRLKQPTRITDRTILRLFGLTRGDEILTSFDGVAAGGGVAARVLVMLGDRAADGVGIDTPDGQAFIDQMAAAGVLTTDEATQLKALAKETVSPGRAEGLGEILPSEIYRAKGGS